MVVAESRYIAEDALDDIEVELEPLPAVVDLEAALAPGAALVHEDLGSNIAAQVPQTKGDYAQRGRERRTWSSRAASATTAALRRAIENRGVVAQWDARASR